VCLRGDGIRKPDPGIFQTAAERAGCDLAGGGWMVGDNLSADVAGGAGSGCGRSGPEAGGQSADAAAEPDHVVADVVDAIKVLCHL